MRCEPAGEAAAIRALMAAAELHRTASHFGPTREIWAQKLAAIRTAHATLDPSRLNFRERVAAQNAVLKMALKAALYGAASGAEATRDLAREAAAFIARFALPPAAFAAPAVDPALADWLGPRGAWIEKRLPGEAPMFHEQVYFLTRSFRIVEAGGRRFIFSQLIAVDSAWRPHVTSVVGDIEMRQGAAREAPACIVVFEPQLARCASGAGLAAIARGPISHVGGYVLVDRSGRANCASCHQREAGPLGLRLEAIPNDEVAAFLAAHRARLIADLAPRLEPIRDAMR